MPRAGNALVSSMCSARAGRSDRAHDWHGADARQDWLADLAYNICRLVTLERFRRGMKGKSLYSCNRSSGRRRSREHDDQIENSTRPCPPSRGKIDHCETSRYRAVFERPSYLTRLRRTDWLGREDSNLCISESEFTETLVSLAQRHRWPAVYPYRSFVIAGGLISYDEVIE